MAQTSIMIVEDESIVALDIKVRLTRLGYLVRAVVSSGEEAVPLAIELSPDLILMDIQLKGGIDGIAAAKAIQSKVDLPVIYLTAYADQPTLQRAKITAPYGYLLKPFEERELHSTIEMALYRHQLERRLKDSERWLNTTLKSIGDAVVATDCGGRIKFMNPVAQLLTGWSDADALGQPLETVVKIIHSKTRQPISLPIAAVLKDTLPHKLAEDGMIVSHNGREVPIRDSLSPILDENGQMMGVVLVFQDVTEHVRMEEQYRQAQKMEAIGLLAGGIAHDFNNLLTAINGFAELAEMRLAHTDPVRPLMGNILRAGQRAAKLVSQMLAFSRKQIIQPEQTDLNVVIERMDNILRGVTGENIQIKMDFQFNLWPVNVDPNQMEQVIINLAVNARDAMPDGGIFQLKTENLFLDEAQASGKSQLQAGRHILLTVSDTGIGMGKKVLEHIFEPFFTTKEVGKGTGLGLASVYGIVMQNNGHIEAHSEINRGATFKIYLPATPATTEEPKIVPETEVTEEIPQGHERILVVEDENAVRRLIVMSLEEQGYQVAEAGNGTEALAKLRETGGRNIDLLLTDVVMPDINGRALAEQFLRVFPDAKVLFMSGYAESVVKYHGLPPTATNFMQKPFSSLTLYRKIRDVLDDNVSTLL